MKVVIFCNNGYEESVFCTLDTEGLQVSNNAIETVIDSFASKWPGQFRWEKVFPRKTFSSRNAAIVSDGHGMYTTYDGMHKKCFHSIAIAMEYLSQNVRREIAYDLCCKLCEEFKCDANGVPKGE